MSAWQPLSAADEDPLSYTLPNFVPRRSNELKTQVPYEVTVDLLCYSNSVTCDVKMLENERMELEQVPGPGLCDYYRCKVLLQKIERVCLCVCACWLCMCESERLNNWAGWRLRDFETRLFQCRYSTPVSHLVFWLHSAMLACGWCDVGKEWLVRTSQTWWLDALSLYHKQFKQGLMQSCAQVYRKCWKSRLQNKDRFPYSWPLVVQCMFGLGENLLQTEISGCHIKPQRLDNTWKCQTALSTWRHGLSGTSVNRTVSDLDKIGMTIEVPQDLISFRIGKRASLLLSQNDSNIVSCPSQIVCSWFRIHNEMHSSIKVSI